MGMVAVIKKRSQGLDNKQDKKFDILLTDRRCVTLLKFVTPRRLGGDKTMVSLQPTACRNENNQHQTPLCREDQTMKGASPSSFFLFLFLFSISFCLPLLFVFRVAIQRFFSCLAVCFLGFCLRCVSWFFRFVEFCTAVNPLFL